MTDTDLSNANIDSLSEVQSDSALQPPISLKKGDVIVLGRYNEEDIPWLILDIVENKALLISESVIDCLKFSDNVLITGFWFKCSMRSWLNKKFFAQVFSEIEAAHILPSLVKQDFATPLPSGFEPSEDDIVDRLFLLSVAEADKYFEDDNDRLCGMTALALKHKARFIEGTDIASSWWLRDLGIGPRRKRNGKFDYTKNRAALIFEGKILDKGVRGDAVSGIRPAFWLDISDIKLNYQPPVKKNFELPEAPEESDDDSAGQDVNDITALQADAYEEITDEVLNSSSDSATSEDSAESSVL